ncbi:hypothetical protein RO575_08315 [Methylomonas sp. MO1]|uniref:hypothetical protein n=1 Tax=Methylomonas sp. MO1 TaxID=3073619 RepID=UPI0028A498A0|nr:hypothetical protein [Methylomonas sp. MO1]MDT4289560.1 hypothetical protein [Methylomonas sp. MO1]
MEPEVPLPTDNIYKFYAMFGLVVMLTTGIMFFIRAEEYNRRAFERYAPIRILEAKDKLTDSEKLDLFIHEQKQAIDKSNKEFELGLYVFLFLLPGTLSTAYGFYMWHTKIQPKQDELIDLQIERLKVDIKLANKEVQRRRYVR